MNDIHVFKSFVHRFIGIKCFSRRTFFYHQKKYIHGVIARLWKKKQGELLSAVKGNGSRLHLAGDARCDSMGHSAKYGTYTVMDIDSRKVLVSELIQVCIYQNA